MPTFMEMLNQGLGNLTGTPLGQIGTQLLMASGPQQGNPGMGARLGQAVAGMGDMQINQQRLQQTEQLRQFQQMTMMRQMRAMQQEEQQRAAIQDQVKNDPSFLANNPMARQIVGATGDFGMAAELAKLNPQPKAPNMKQTYDQHNPDGTVTQQVYNYDTGKYEAGATYRPTAQQNVDIAGARYNMDAFYRPQEFELKQQNADTVAQNAGVAAQRSTTAFNKEQRETAAALKKNNIDAEQLRQGYTGAASQIDETIADANNLLNHPGFNSLFGPDGMVTAIPGTEAANAKALYDQFVSKIGFSELQRLKQMGISLTPTSNVDVENAQKSAASIARSQSNEGARQSLQTYIQKMQKARGEAESNYNRMSSLYQQSAPSGQSQPQLPSVGSVMDGYRYNGGDPADPASWSKQ